MGFAKGNFEIGLARLGLESAVSEHLEFVACLRGQSPPARRATLPTKRGAARLLAAAALGLLFLPGLRTPLEACACCADPQTLAKGTAKPGDYYVAPLAELHLEGAFAEVTDPNSERPPVLLKGKWRITGRFPHPNGIEFSLQAGPEGAGPAARFTATFTEAHYIQTDLEELSSPGSVVLYKEISIRTTLTVSGPLEQVLGKNVAAVLVIQGRGNNCQIPENYQRWFLQFERPVRGETIRLQAFGKVRR